MADLLPYQTDTSIDPITGIATVTVTSFGPQSQQYQAAYTSSVPGIVPVQQPGATVTAEIASVVKTTNAEAVTKSTPSKSVTKVSTPKTHN